MTKTFFIGDMEGQHKVFQRSIKPIVEQEDTKLISLGNLISCYNDEHGASKSSRNTTILKMWTDIEVPKLKLMGPNELLALNFPERWTNHVSNEILRDGWLSKKKNYLSALAHDDRLVTHGGLTYGEWLSIGKPTTAFDAAEALNEKYANTLYQGDCFKLTGTINPAANAIWADGITELYPSWLYASEECPFEQILGGESLNNERASQLKNNIDHPLYHLDQVEFKDYGSRASIRGTDFTCVDYHLGTEFSDKFRQDRSLYAEES
jgi:hypothetical protein